MHAGTPVHANELGKTVVSPFTMALENILIGTWTRLVSLSSHRPSNEHRKDNPDWDFAQTKLLTRESPRFHIHVYMVDDSKGDDGR